VRKTLLISSGGSIAAEDYWRKAGAKKRTARKDDAGE
jgi:hypothetical protein